MDRTKQKHRVPSLLWGVPFFHRRFYLHKDPGGIETKRKRLRSVLFFCSHIQIKTPLHICTRFARKIIYLPSRTTIVERLLLCDITGGHDTHPDKAPVAIMFHHFQLGLLTLAGPIVSVYFACAVPCLAILRKLGKCPPASALPDEDLSGRVVIVTGANTGKWIGLPTQQFVRVAHDEWCSVLLYRWLSALSSNAEFD